MYNHQLDTFLVVAEAGSFSRAAEKLYISTTAVIKQVDSLEHSLHVKLFKRTHRGVILTAAGKSFYKDTKCLITYANRSVLRAQQAELDSQNVIRVGISPLTPAEYVVSLWPKIRKALPDLRFQFVSFKNQGMKYFHSQFGKSFDINFGIYYPDFAADMDCRTFDIHDEPLSCALSIYHPLFSKKVISVEDFKNYPLIVNRKGWNTTIDLAVVYLRSRYPDMKIKEVSDENLQIFDHCAHSNDLTLTWPCWDGYQPLLAVKKVKWNYRLPFGMVYPKNPSPLIQRLVDTLDKLKREHQL